MSDYSNVLQFPLKIRVIGIELSVTYDLLLCYVASFSGETLRGYAVADVAKKAVRLQREKDKILYNVVNKSISF